jgi:hypothetical protein
MGRILSLADMQEQYDGEWLLIAYTELDEDMQPIAGEVITHSPDREVVYRELLRQRGKSVAIEYVGTVSEDLATAL